MCARVRFAGDAEGVRAVVSASASATADPRAAAACPTAAALLLERRADADRVAHGEGKVHTRSRRHGRMLRVFCGVQLRSRV